MAKSDRLELVLDGSSLTLEELARAARDPRIRVSCDERALGRVAAGAKQVKGIVDRYREQYGKDKAKAILDYGVTTGFGEFKKVPIDPGNLPQLSRNILLSHSAGVGDNADRRDPANYFPAEVVRAALLLRLNTFLKGHSGVRPRLLEVLVAMINRGIVPLVPLHGSVGSSGDLAPLSHLFVVLLGEGAYYRVRTAADIAASGRRSPRVSSGKRLGADLGKVLAKDLKARVSYKEGLALTNGATFSAAILALAVVDAEALAGAADAAAALSLEAVCGCARALDPKVHGLRGHRGQGDSADNLRRLLDDSKLIDSKAKEVQDAYSLRCAPVVHGASRDTIAYAKMVVEREINSVTDNPLFFPEEEEDRELVEQRWDEKFKKNWPRGRDGYKGSLRRSFSAGNFHGQPVGLAADFLAIALAELANISERRTQTLMDENHSRGLPANLIPEGGVNSGFMIAQYCAASLVSENKVLTHPASVDSIPTSSNSEDHVAMATAAARKLRRVLANVQATLAIELVVAAQAVEWRNVLARSRWTQLSKALQKRKETEFRKLTAPRRGGLESRRQKVAEMLGAGTGRVYLEVRTAAAAMREDRTLDEDLRKVRRRLETGELTRAASAAVQGGLIPVAALASPAPREDREGR